MTPWQQAFPLRAAESPLDLHRGGCRRNLTCGIFSQGVTFFVGRAGTLRRILVGLRASTWHTFRDAPIRIATSEPRGAMPGFNQESGFCGPGGSTWPGDGADSGPAALCESRLPDSVWPQQAGPTALLPEVRLDPWVALRRIQGFSECAHESRRAHA